MTRGSLCFLYLRNVRRPRGSPPTQTFYLTCLIVAGSAGYFRTVTVKEQTPVTSVAGFRDASSPRIIHDWLVSPSERKHRSWLAHHPPGTGGFFLPFASLSMPLSCDARNFPLARPIKSYSLEAASTTPGRARCDSITTPSGPHLNPALCRSGTLTIVQLFPASQETDPSDIDGWRRSTEHGLPKQTVDTPMLEHPD